MRSVCLKRRKFPFVYPVLIACCCFPEREKVYSRQYSAPILKRKTSRFGLGQFRVVIAFPCPSTAISLLYFYFFSFLAFKFFCLIIFETLHIGEVFHVYFPTFRRQAEQSRATHSEKYCRSEGKSSRPLIMSLGRYASPKLAAKEHFMP